MSVDDRDKKSDRDSSRSPSERESIKDALQSDTDEPLPPAAEVIANRDAQSPHPVTPQGRRRRFLNRRNLVIATIAAAAGVVALILLILIVYRLGYVDRYVAGQIKDTYALNSQRNITLKDLKIEGLETWVTFDEQGRSNFRNIHIPPPETNRRILLAYTAAHIEIKSGIIHYGDARHEISGEARNLQALILPKDPNLPPEIGLHPVTVSFSNSTFTYDGRPVNNIDIQARLKANETRVEIQELVLRSPMAEAHLSGTMDDWRALSYQMNITSTVDLTQLSDVLQSGTTLRGTGNFAGVVSGRGDQYKVDGSIKSDSLAADGVRLQGLTVNANGTGQ